MTVTWREQTPADEAFVTRLLMEAISEELGPEAWPEAVRQPLLETQVGSRRLRAGPGGRIALIDGQPAGWLAVAETVDELRLVDIVILPACRGQGAGSALVRDLAAQAERSGRPLRLSVLTGSPAIRLYERLGFHRTGGDEVRIAMERRPGA